MNVLRWGRSEYETLFDLELEREGAESLSLGWSKHDDSSRIPNLNGVHALVVNSRTRVDANAIDRFKGSLILTTTSGYDHIDLDAAAAKNITVARMPQIRRDAVVHHALSGMIALMRSFPQFQRAAREGRWAREDLPMLAPVALSNATVTVVGLGVVGQAMATTLTQLGAKVLAVDPAGVPEGLETCPLDEALSRSNAVTLHCSLTPSSENLFTGARIDKMPRGGVLVNTARGSVLDVEAAVERVRTGQLRGLLVDVFPGEPYRRLAEGAAVPGVVFTPHAAGYTKGMGQRVAHGVTEALRAWKDGAPLPHEVLATDR
jgi:D-3-phosphoglycerate dehydrogenase / 2-oxoglutarate reductase